MPTKQYMDLRARLKHLQSTLPNPSTQPHTLTISELDQMTAVALLVSAACEQFVEIRCLQLADNAMQRFAQNQTIHRVGMHLCVFPFMEVPKDKVDMQKLSEIVGNSGFGIRMTKGIQSLQKVQIGDLLERGYKRYKKVVERNHGISLKHQIKLMGMIGIDISDFDPSFKSSIISLTGFRGRAAHTHVVAAVTLPSPNSVSNWVADFIVGFAKLDRAFDLLDKRKN